MKPAELLAYLHKHGIEISAVEDRLSISSVRGTMTPELRATLIANKSELLALLQQKQHITAAHNTSQPAATQVQTWPLSFTQQMLWFLDQLEPGNPVYNIPTALLLQGPISVENWERSFQEIVKRHEVLRTTFPAHQGTPSAVVSPAILITLPVIDLEMLTENNHKTLIDNLITQFMQRPFDLARGPLLRLALLRLEPQKHVLLINMHHIIADAWSMEIMTKELSLCYTAFTRRTPLHMPKLPIQYTGYAVWQRSYLQGEVMDRLLGYWKKQLANLPELELPTDARRPAVQTYHGAECVLVLPSDLTDALEQLAHREGCTLFMVLLTAFAILLSRHSHQEDIVIGIPIANRTQEQTENLIGFFMNNLVLRIDLSERPTFTQALSRVRETTLNAYAHQELPFEYLLQSLPLVRDLSRSPLFQVFFNLRNLPQEALSLPELRVERFPLSEHLSTFDLNLYPALQPDGLHLQLIYNADLFTHQRMLETMQQFQSILQQVVQKPGQPVVDISLLTPQEHTILPDPTAILDDSWRGAIHECCTQHAQHTPERIALEDTFGAWSYHHLETLSNQLAHYLYDHGVNPQDVVAIYGYRSAALIWAILGILKAGATYSILDPAYPPSRLIDYVQVLKPRAWLHIQNAGTLPPELERVAASTVHERRLTLPVHPRALVESPWTRYPEEAPARTIGPDTPAVISFTSGTEGKPKGILGRHGPLTHFLPWQYRTFALQSTDRFVLLSGLSHDPLQREIFTSLWSGATLYIPDDELILQQDIFYKWLQERQITVFHLSPAWIHLFAQIRHEDDSLTAARLAFIVGDILTRQDVHTLRQIAPSITCINLYGSTETQRAVSLYTIGEEASPETESSSRQHIFKERIPLGQEMPDVQVLILREGLRRAAVNEVGDIYIRSPHLASGYLHAPALTQERFLQNPFSQQPGDRLYRTGDRGRYQPDGTIDFLGRVDQQIQLRGFRIELEEIEAVLMAHPQVQQCAVIVVGEEPAERMLIAYIVPGATQSQPVGDIVRRFLEERLPAYMVPAHIIAIDTLPMTPNRKTDRQALARLKDTLPRNRTDYVAPRTRIEQTIASVWQEVLGVSNISRNDSFFDLGGHSLLLAQTQSKLCEALQHPVTVIDIFRYPTVNSLARHLTGTQEETAHSTQKGEDRGRNRRQLLALHRGRQHVTKSSNQEGANQQ